MIIADISENVSVPSVSNLFNIIPPWNSQDAEYVLNIFKFASLYLQNDGALCLILNNDQKLAAEIFNQANAFDYVLHKDYWGINELGLASPTNPGSKIIYTVIIP